MAVDVRNLIVGHGNLYYQDVDPDAGTTHELPNFTTGSTLGEQLETAGWTDVGATQDGVELTYTPDYGEVEVDQLKGTAKMFNTSVTVTLSTNLVEATFENLLVSWGIGRQFLDAASEGSSTFSIGMSPGTLDEDAALADQTPWDDPVERSLAVVSKGTPTDGGTRRQRVYLGRRAVSVEGSTLALRRTEATVFPVSFRLLPDPAFTNQEFGEIVDVVPAAPAP